MRPQKSRLLKDFTIFLSICQVEWILPLNTPAAKNAVTDGILRDFDASHPCS